MEQSIKPTTEPRHNEIEKIAQTLWQQAGKPKDRDLDFWLQAEKQVKPMAIAQPATLTSGTQTPTKLSSKRG